MSLLGSQKSWRVTADLRDAALGGLDRDAANIYQRSDFSQADMRGTAYISAEFDECVFSNTRLDSVDFQGCRFTNCTFRGVLRDVLFYERASRAPQMPVNTMQGVDFSQASLEYVDFRGLNLESVRWPSDQNHFVISDYRKTLQRMLEKLRDADNPVARQLTTFLELKLKWSGPRQTVGIIAKYDLSELGPQAVDHFLRALGS